MVVEGEDDDQTDEPRTAEQPPAPTGAGRSDGSAFSENSHDPSQSSLASTHTNGDEPTSNWITKQRRPGGSIGRAGAESGTGRLFGG